MAQGLRLSPDTHVLIRVARPADAASLIAHRRRSCTESCFLAFYPDEISDDVEAQARIIEAAGEDPHRAILVATTGDEVIGFAGYLPAGPGRKAAHRAGIALSVDEAHAGRGIGRALLAALADHARASGIRQLELGVYEQNERARRLYERFGFTTSGHIPAAYVHDDGSVHDEVQMVLAL